jgi:uncharacterized protein (TIGR04255 family)
MSDQQKVRGKPLSFKNPPIVEAIIAFQISPLPESALEDFDASVDAMAALGYKQPQPVTKHEVQIKIDGQSSALNDRESKHGLRFISEDELHAVQFNRDGFVFSRLGHYSSWDLFRKECKKTWDVYIRVSGVGNILNYGVRYINKLYMPLGEDSEQYIKIFPHLPVEIPNMIKECFMRLTLPINEPQGQLIHQQILIPPDKPNFSALLLDNDFRFSALTLTVEEVWDQLEKVRTVKDYYFDVFTTDKMQETFNV